MAFMTAVAVHCRMDSSVKPLKLLNLTELLHTI